MSVIQQASVLLEKVGGYFANGAPERRAGGLRGVAGQFGTRQEDTAPGPLRSRHPLLSRWENEDGSWRLVLEGQHVLGLGCPPHWSGRNSSRLHGRGHHPQIWNPVLTTCPLLRRPPCFCSLGKL